MVATIIRGLCVAVFASIFLSRTFAGVTIPESSTCSHINSEYSACKVQIMCSLCVTTGTCEFDVVSLSCEMKSAEAIANGTATMYCNSNDTVCSACEATAADPICTGDDGSCICQSLCSIIQPIGTSDCSRSSDSATARRYLVRAFESQLRRESEMLRMRQPQLALNLVGWRDTVELNKPELSLHKLGACCYIMKQEEGGHHTDAMAAISVDEGEPDTSMETSTTLSVALDSSISSQESVSACCSPAASEHDSECDFNTMSDNKSR
ncbi:hypothetical protein PF008_g2189 [Phytophthora fragariae]|uniref:TNFR-Cys domain-containing protein n=1 Tax=Phytophthora fragariae TaxID=53985 RepID=A0A6G0SJ00_9STRA|nr:hypothetical protein PF008_g2189 [Phytophthora fragariae]